jgi:hypothetical protein
MLGAIKRQLLEQLRAALREKEGGSGLGDLLGPALARSCRRSWIHFNLREVIQLLNFSWNFKFSIVVNSVVDPDPDLIQTLLVVQF